MNADLRADLLLYLDDRDVNGQYEAIAEKFYRETGYMRPGKSMPIEMCVVDDDERMEAWRQWCAEWKLRLIDRVIKEP
jgi:hypothetical protein